MISDKVLCVVGQDIDAGLVKTLQAQHGIEAGDMVLVEMNGTRLFSNLSCPLVVEEPWEVMWNDDVQLILRHPSTGQELTLPYQSMLPNKPEEPAVFVIKDPRFSNGPIYCLLQFVAYRVAVDALEEFKPEFDLESFDEILENKQARSFIEEQIVNRVKTFTHPGWNYDSVCRFALRSNVRAKVIEAFRRGDKSIIQQQNVETLKRIIAELSWMKMFKDTANSGFRFLDYEKQAPDEEFRLNISRG